MMKTLIVSLDSQVDSLEIVGGKGRSLAKLTNAGFDIFLLRLRYHR
jgi:phosphoenolpyruvate synthase/pyruvate phosphate dikinase